MGVYGLNYLKIKEAIGKPYSLDYKVDHFNCWTLINYIYPHSPLFSPKEMREYIKLFNEQKQNLSWIEVENKQEGDIILLAKNNFFSHAGIYLKNNKLLHATDKAGVVIEDFNMIKLKYKNIKAYRWL